MKNFFALILSVTGIAAVAQTTPSAVELSPAQKSIAEAQSSIHEKPGQYTGYNLLATALVRRARETDDASYYSQAEEAAKNSLDLSPNNFETEKIQVSILLGEHDFATALDQAKILNKKVPDDVLVYGMLADANAALGKYKDAETAAQWMLDLRPGNRPALVHAAALRELFGDPDGSYELLDLALQSTPFTESEERAWVLTQMGHERLISGNTDAAEKLLTQALVTFPNYSYALDNLAQVRIAQKRYEEALLLLKQDYQSYQHTRSLYELAEALQLARHDEDAKKAFAEFEAKSLQESDKKDNSKLQLVFYYADYAHQPVKALQVAQQEFSWRQDVYTLDAYAWALHVNGRDAEARKQIETALTVGTRDANLFRHAGEIARKLGDISAAKSYFQQAANLNAANLEPAKLASAGANTENRK
jgi:tetratricopeptide (TPR) repeat protein